MFGIIFALAIVVAIGLSVLSFIKMVFTSATSVLFGHAEPEPSFDDANFARSRLIQMEERGKITLNALNEILMILNLRSFIPGAEIRKPISPGESFPSQESIQPQPFKANPQPAAAYSFNEPKIPSQAAAPSSGLMMSDNIKTMLISGSALFIFGAYLFTRSYWDFIPDLFKMGLLLIATISVYLTGRYLLDKSQTPRTAESLILIALILIPLNVYASNLFLFNHVFTADGIWSVGFIGMFIVSLLTAGVLEKESIGLMIGSAFLGFMFFGARAFSMTLPSQLFAVALGVLLLLIGIISIILNEKIKKGIFYALNTGAFAVAVTLAAKQFFILDPNLWITGSTVAVLGAAFALQARFFKAEFAYAAGISFMGAGVLFLRNFNVPSYQYGLYFVPGSLLSILRAWKFQKTGRENLAAPYFNLGQIALAGSLVSLFPSFSFYVGTGYMTMMGIQVLAIVAYSTMGVLYRKPFFTYASGAVFLLLLWTFVSHNDFSFASGILIFSGAAFVLSLIGTFIGDVGQEQVGTPFKFMGLGTLSVSLALVAGKWGNQFISEGWVAPVLPADQLNSGLIVGILSIVAYSLLGSLQKDAKFAYPAMVSATLVYFLGLEKMGIAINLLHVSWIIPFAMIASYFARRAKWEELARSFSIWGELCFFGIGLSALASKSPEAFSAVLIGALSFIPALWIGSFDLVTFFVGGIYLVHAVWFRQSSRISSHMADYSQELVMVNMGIIFLRTVVTYALPRVEIEPFRVFSIIFSAISMALSLSDPGISWVIFLIYGVLGIIVSFVHYEGRNVYIGTTLLLISYELFISHQKIELVEAYSVPAALYLLACGYLNRANREAREACYRFGLCFLYLPSFIKSVNENWELHGVFLGITSLVVMLIGMAQKNKSLTFISFIVLLLNGVVQSHLFFNAIPRWVHLGGGGILLITLGGIFEFKREAILRVKSQLTSTFDDWE